jgi:hypothetical protein
MAAEEWLIPRTLTNIANRLGNITPKKAKILLKPYELKTTENRQLWTVRLDKMPLNIRRQLEKA